MCRSVVQEKFDQFGRSIIVAIKATPPRVEQLFSHWTFFYLRYSQSSAAVLFSINRTQLKYITYHHERNPLWELILAVCLKEHLHLLFKSRNRKNSQRPTTWLMVEELTIFGVPHVGVSMVQHEELKKRHVISPCRVACAHYVLMELPEHDFVTLLKPLKPPLWILKVDTQIARWLFAFLGRHAMWNLVRSPLRAVLTSFLWVTHLNSAFSRRGWWKGASVSLSS